MAELAMRNENNQEEELLLSNKYKAFLKHDAIVEFLEGGQIKKMEVSS